MYNFLKIICTTMLQIMASERIQRFYKDIQGLDIKYPVSAIAEATGETKGNVSKYLNQKMQPSESFLNRFYMKFGKVVQKSDTTRPQTAQNGANSSQPPTLTRIGEVIKLIQYKTNPTLTIEQIADRIDYSRQTLQTLIKEGDSQKVFDKLHEAFKDELNHTLTTSTKIPGFEMKPTSGTPTVQDVTIEKLSDLAKSQHELVKEVTGKLITLVSKVIDKL